MFDSDLERLTSPKLEGATDVRRRVFLGSAVAALGGLALWQWKKPAVLEAASAASEPKDVTIVLFSDSGQRLKQVRIAQVIKTAAEWRKQLPFGSLRHHAQRRHRNRILWKVLEPARQGSLSLHLLR